MAVYKPNRKGETSKYYVCEFVYQGKRFQESTGATTKTLAKEYEKRRRAEMERAAAGLPTQQRATRIRTVNDVVGPYLAAYKVSHRPKSILFAEGRLAHVKKALGNVVLSDLRMIGYLGALILPLLVRGPFAPLIALSLRCGPETHGIDAAIWFLARGIDRREGITS